uniref:Uncharacterized protein n=1 Tax=Anguilla anguilla TaxID=7936 RepID=A0A0E9V1U1_ANGAN
MSLMWSQMAFAADMALDSFLALMTAAPRCCTVDMKIPLDPAVIFHSIKGSHLFCPGS